MVHRFAVCDDSQEDREYLGKLIREWDKRAGYQVRIDTIVDRYQGYISRNSEDGAFTTEILLPQ